MAVASAEDTYSALNSFLGPSSSDKVPLGAWSFAHDYLSREHAPDPPTTWPLAFGLIDSGWPRSSPEAIREHGYCPLHRKTFRGVKEHQPGRF